MKYLPIINIFLIFVLFGFLFIYQSNINNQIIGEIRTLNSETNNINTKILEIETDTDKLNADIKEAKKESSTLFEQVNTKVSDLNLKQTEEFDELSRQISKVNVGDDFSQVVEDSIDSIVSISTDKKFGSGVIVDEDGYIITNEHVVRGISAAAVKTYDGKIHRMYVVDSDRDIDIAVIKIDGDYEALRFGNSENVQIGEKVIALGSPGGFDFTVTQGIVSAHRFREGHNFIQTDVSIHPGSSGGPLLDSSGRIIGINTEKSADFEGIGFAIESNEIEDFVKDSINNDKEKK